MSFNHWSEEELRVAVDAYFEMLDKELSSESYDKSKIREKYLSNKLPNRSKASFELRMCNISSCLKDEGYTYIDGYKPLANVGNNIRDYINKYISKTYAFSNKKTPTEFNPFKTCWLILEKSQETIISSGIEGYKDLTGKEYECDSMVPNSKNLKVNDFIMFRKEKHVIGFAVIDDIIAKSGLKKHRRCPNCKSTDIRRRISKKLNFRCGKCKYEFNYSLSTNENVTKYTVKFKDFHNFSRDLHYKEVKFCSLKGDGINSQLSIMQLDPDKIFNLFKGLSGELDKAKRIIINYSEKDELKDVDGSQIKEIHSENYESIRDNPIDMSVDLIEEKYFQKNLKEAREDFERDYLSFHINRFKGNITETSKFIKMDRSALHRKIRDLNIDPKNESEHEEIKKTYHDEDLDEITQKNLANLKKIRESISGRKPIIKVKKDDIDKKKNEAFTKKFESYNDDNETEGRSIKDPFSIMRKNEKD